MFVKLQLDTNCFLVCSSSRTTPNFKISASPNYGVSVSPLENAEPIKKLKQQRLLETSNGAVKKLNLIHKENWDKVSADDHNPSSDKPDIQKKSNWDYAESTKKQILGAKLKDVNGNSSVEKVHTKCSTKFPNYGGCIPSILNALDTIEDLDEAMKPWEDTLSNKERSIILKEQSNWERAMEIFEWLKRKGCYELNVIHYNIMIKILGKARQWDHLKDLCNEMYVEKIPLINSTYGTLIDVYTKGGLVNEALQWLEKMNEQGMEPDEVTMGIVMQMYKKSGEFKKAEGYFKKWSSNDSLTPKRIAKDTKATLNARLNSYTYNTLIDTYGKSGKVKEASETFSEMIAKGIMPTTVTFNTMIHIYGNHGHLEDIEGLIRKMEDLKCPPDTRTYNILISLHAKHNDINKAAHYFKTMKSQQLEPDLVSYRTLLYALSIRHMVNEAESLVSEMDSKGLEIDEYTQSALTRMYIEAGMLEKSWLWFKRFHLLGNMSPECYSANIDAYGERGHILEASRVFESCLERKKLSVLEFNVMIKAYGLGKNYDKACDLFDSMEIHGVVPDKCSYNCLIQILASGDLPEKANLYLRKMQEARLVGDCILYCAVISSFVKLGNLEMVEKVYNEMIRFNVKPDVIVYGVLINAFAEIGSVKEAMCYFDAMKRAGLSGNVVIYNSLIKLYTKVGYLREALEIYELLQSLDDGPDVYSSNCMIDLYSEQAMVKQAEEIFEKMKEKGIANEFTYAMMLCMYKRLGNFIEASQIAKRMRELGLLSDLLSYNNVIGLYAIDSRFRDALGTFREMIGANIQPDDCTFKNLGMILVKCGISKKAVRKLEGIRKKDFRDGLQAWLTTLSTVIEVEDDDSFVA